MSWPPADLCSDGVLPGWSAHGALPAGDYWPTQGSFEAVLVRVEGSSTRAAIYSGWNSHRSALRTVGCDDMACCLLNGSYTTTKQDPNDLDLVVFLDVDPDDADSVTRFERAAPLLQGPKAKDPYLCDAYAVPVLPRSHPDHEAVTAKAKAYWLKWFARDRAGRLKGRVWTRLGGFR